ncbi:hypothetical protein GH714_033226 [Hevea brasiliensis]|uniref:NADH dehydrogenase [ubiquinone] iron-sulfur protein 4, mitochondrial n=1 Tax=Hevea brasiliensis TaxID=3981 RepID=A0A6A6L559_HEVBR|nr:hypothetical protein GH714_033226 [Hevea brasiliensis]
MVATWARNWAHSPDLLCDHGRIGGDAGQARRDRWENPLMGWTSTGDPYANVGDAGLSFDSEEAAKAFAERHGWEYVVRKRQTPQLKVKSYADNFKFKGLPKTEDK